MFVAETRGDAVITGQIKVDDFDSAGARTVAVAGGRGLQETAGKVARFSQKEEADLRDVGTGGDVDQVVFGISIERIVTRKDVESFVDFFKIPRIVRGEIVQTHFSFRRRRFDIGLEHLSQTRVRTGMQKFQAVNDEIGLSADGNGGTPTVPAIGLFAEVQSCA